MPPKNISPQHIYYWILIQFKTVSIEIVEHNGWGPMKVVWTLLGATFVVISPLLTRSGFWIVPENFLGIMFVSPWRSDPSIPPRHHFTPW